MLKFAANLSTLFREVNFLDRFEQAALAGFRAVEFQFSYSYTAESILELLDRFNLELVLHNLPPGDWEKGDRGMACDPDRISEFRDALGIGLGYASLLRPLNLNCLAGLVPQLNEPDTIWRTLRENLEYTAEACSARGFRLMIEVLNTPDVPGFMLDSSEKALKLISEVRSQNLFLQYDFYHMQIMEGNLAKTLEDNLNVIGHIQIADNPGRHQPGTGEINFPYLFDHLERIGYAGWIGCEYVPLGNTHESLDWIKSYLA